MKHIFLLFAVCVLVFSFTATSQVPNKISYQGLLTTSSGAPVTDGSYNLKFDIYNLPSGGLLRYTQTRNGVSVSKGTFSVILGPMSAIFSESLYVQVTALAGSPGISTDITFSPRSELTSAPYSLAPWTTSGNNIYYNGGNVGIGTTSPGDLLDIYGGTGNIDDQTAAVLFSPRGGYGTGSGGARIAGAVESNTPGDRQTGLSFKTYEQHTGLAEYMRISGTGNVGIGTTSPGAKLDIYDSRDTSTALNIVGRLTNYGIFSVENYWGIGRVSVKEYGNTNIYFDAETGHSSYFNNGGNVGIGTTNPAAKLDVKDNPNAVYLFGPPVGYFGSETADKIALVGDATAGVSMLLPTGMSIGVYGSAFGGTENWAGYFNGNLYASDNVGIGTPLPDAKLTIKGDGVILKGYNTSGQVIFEMGEGLDYSEAFPASQNEITPGTVMVIDPANKGFLTISTQAYDTKVAGIVAGANGLGSGVRLGSSAGSSGKNAVALAGRVYCNVDTQYGDIQPGDLLTTCPTPGHAMVVKDFSRAHGAILGKAMEGLSGGGQGQILTLVTLQ
jgi:hypothetical protein